MLKLQTENYPFSAIYLFGSCAKNKAKKSSDIDVAVISDKLKKDWNRNEDQLWRYAFQTDTRLEPVGFTIQDFKNNADPLVSEIKKLGIKIS